MRNHPGVNGENETGVGLKRDLPNHETLGFKCGFMPATTKHHKRAPLNSINAEPHRATR